MFEENIYRAEISARVRLNLRTNIKQCKRDETTFKCMPSDDPDLFCLHCSGIE